MPNYLDYPSAFEQDEQGSWAGETIRQNRDLVEWLRIKPYIARLKSSSEFFRRSVLTAIIGSGVLGLLTWASLIDPNEEVRRRMIPVGIGLSVATAAMFAFSVWASVAWRTRRNQVYDLYFRFFPELHPEECYVRHPDELETWLQFRFERKESGLTAPEAEYHLGYPPQEVFLQPRMGGFLARIGMAAAVFLLFKLVIGHQVTARLFGSKPPEWHSAITAFGFVFVIWIVVDLIDQLFKRMRP